MKQIQARVIASLVEVAGGRTQEWFDGLKPVDQKKYLKEHPSSKFGQKSGKPAAGPGARGQAKGPGTVKSLNKTKDEITNIRQANAKMKEIKEQLDKATKARPRTEEGKKAKALAIKKLTKLHDGIKRHKDDLIYYAKQKPLHLPASPTKRDAPKSAPAEKTGAKDQPAPKAAPKGAPAGSRAAKPGAQKTGNEQKDALNKMTGVKRKEVDKAIDRLLNGGGKASYRDEQFLIKQFGWDEDGEDFEENFKALTAREDDDEDDEESLFLRDPSEIKLAPKAAPKGAPAGSRAAKPGLRTTVPKGSSSAGGPKGAPRASKFAGIGGGGKPAANPATKPKGIPRR